MLWLYSFWTRSFQKNCYLSAKPPDTSTRHVKATFVHELAHCLWKPEVFHGIKWQQTRAYLFGLTSNIIEKKQQKIHYITVLLLKAWIGYMFQIAMFYHLHTNLWPYEITVHEELLFFLTWKSYIIIDTHSMHSKHRRGYYMTLLVRFTVRN
jgi:hypothetical protein